MPSQDFAITTSAGHTLDGKLEIPTGMVRGAAVFAHCFTCTKQSHAAVNIARALSELGIACLRFDFTGLGGSEGDFGRAGFASDIADLIEAVTAIHDRFGGKVLLIGHSLGGAAVLAAAAKLGKETIAGIATLGAPSDVRHVLNVIDGDHDAIRRDGHGPVKIGGQAFSISSEFLERTETVDLLEIVTELRLPYLALHSPTDAIVGIEHAGALFDAAYHPKSFVSLADADHLLTNDDDARFAADMIAAWARRYLPRKNDWPMPEKGVVVQTGHGRFGTEVHTDRHRFIADEPKSFGGDDTGPSPYELLLAALGTCTAMTMKMYADRKGWAFDGATIHLTHERNHEEDCEHAIEDEAGEIQALNRQIRLRGEALTQEQRARIIAIADKCPVHRTLEGRLHIHTETAD